MDQRDNSVNPEEDDDVTEPERDEIIKQNAPNRPSYRPSTYIRERKPSLGGLEQTFRFIQNRAAHGKEFIKRSYNTFDYDKCENEVFLYRTSKENYSVVAINQIRSILNFVLIGVISGLIAAVVMISVTVISNAKFGYLASLVNDCKSGTCMLRVLFIWFLFMYVLVFIGTFVVTVIEPTAAGSGVGLCIAFLNGVDVPNIFSLSVVFYKTISTICTCTSGIIGGKEGPMIHISAALGEVIITLPYVCNLCKPFHNNSELRDLVAAGVGSGIAGSFGSPIGGFLLSVEESVSFLNPQLLFRIFLSTMFAVTVMNCTFSAFYKTDQIGTEHYLYLGKLEDSNIAFTLLEFPAFFLMGTIAGLIGSLCVHLQTSITAIRERHLKSNFAKLIESSLVAVLTSVAQVIFMYLSDSCVEAEQPGNAVKMGCKNGYSESSFYTLSTGEETLRWIVHAKINGINFLPAFCMFIIYYVLAMYTVGINIAVGAFVPNLLIGAMWGRCYVILLNKIFPDIKWFDPVKYTFLAAIAQLSGSLRITFSVTIIAVEITGAVNLLLPLMFTLLTAKWVGDLLTPPWFESQIIFLGLPFILPDPPAFSSEVAVKHIMSKQVITLSPVVFAAEILNILTNHEHGVYPVVDKTNSLVGTVASSHILVLLKYRIFLNTSRTLEEIDNIYESEFRKQIKAEDIKLENYENNQKLNLVMIMNSSPYTVRQNMSFERAFVLFRNLGLRQLVVVDSKYQILGIVTRKELARYHAVKDGIIELPLI